MIITWERREFDVARIVHVIAAVSTTGAVGS